MNETNMTSCEQRAEVSVTLSPKTVGEIFDMRIQEARKYVESLCIKKAKLEALNMTNMPYNELSSLLDMYSS